MPMNFSIARNHLCLVALVLAPCLVSLSACDAHPAAGATGAETAASSSATPTAPTPASTAATPVPVQSVALDSKSFTTSGPLVAEQQADIAAERPGHIVEIAVQIGDHVKKGQLLASLDDRQLRSTVEVGRARIASAQAQVNQWEAEESSAKSDLRRADAMRADKIISDENWETAKYKVDETAAEVTRYKSEQAAAEAELNTANLQLEQSRIIAPFSGVVGRSSVRPAQEVKAGDVLFWITAERPLRVLFTVPESVMASFTRGAPLDITTTDFPSLHQPGRILRVSPVIDPASGSVQVIGAVEHPSPLLKPGMTMQVRLAR
jgi:RND family efflux transporter MFP subunit